MRNIGNYDGNQLNIRRLYNDLFCAVPSEFVVSIDELCKYGEDEDDIDFDLKKMNNEFLLDVFPNCEFRKVLCRSKKDVVSCANENDPKTIYGSIYVGSELYQACVIVVNKSDETIIKILEKAVVLFYSGIDPETYIDAIIKKLPLKRDIEDELPVIGLVSCSDNGGYYVVDSEINDTIINIDENYNDDFKEPYDSIIKFIESDERKSGLILLNGEPGTGKTYFLRHLITKFKTKNFILITPHIAARLASPEFMDFLIENKDSIFILEDCEQVIMDRKSNSFSSAVSAVLNMSDGLMSDVFNGKFICTFNADTAAIDEAILRKGRCFANYTFDKLEEKKVKKLLKERGVDLDNPGDMTLADIYNYNVKNVDDSKSKKKIGF